MTKWIKTKIYNYYDRKYKKWLKALVNTRFTSVPFAYHRKITKKTNKYGDLAEKWRIRVQ